MKTTNVGDAFAYSIVTANAIVKGYKDCPLKNVLALDFGTIINKCKNTCINKLEYTFLFHAVFKITK